NPHSAFVHSLRRDTSVLSHSGHCGRLRRASKTLPQDRHSNTNGSTGNSTVLLASSSGTGTAALSSLSAASLRHRNNLLQRLIGVTCPIRLATGVRRCPGSDHILRSCRRAPAR